MSSSSEDSPIYVDSICFRTVVRKNVSPFFFALWGKHRWRTNAWFFEMGSSAVCIKIDCPLIFGLVLQRLRRLSTKFREMSQKLSGILKESIISTMGR
jgi:hypothetical protein